MNGKPYIYLITDIRNGKQYVGKCNHNNPYYFSGGKIICNIVKKHGRKVFIREILEYGDYSNAFLNSLEKHYIKIYDTFNNGYNLTEGGDDGAKTMNAKCKITSSKKREKKVNMFDMNGTFIKSFKSVSDAAKNNNCNVSQISKCLHNNIAFRKKYQFSFDKSISKMDNHRFSIIEVYENNISIGKFINGLDIANKLNIPIGSIHSFIRKGYSKKYNLHFKI